LPRRTYEFPPCSGAASELHRSFAAKDAAQDDIVMNYDKSFGFVDLPAAQLRLCGTAQAAVPK